MKVPAVHLFQLKNSGFHYVPAKCGWDGGTGQWKPYQSGPVDWQSILVVEIVNKAIGRDSYTSHSYPIRRDGITAKGCDLRVMTLVPDQCRLAKTNREIHD